MRRRKVAVHMRGSDPTIEGLLRSWWTWRFGRHYVVEMADLMLAPGNTQELGGTVRIPRENVSWIQVLS
jgi:hypothetical protein